MFCRKAILLISLLLVVFTAASAQQANNYFVYIQSENGQLFYIKDKGDIQSSSTGGYIIIPKLKDGKNKLTVGFPKNQYPEQQFDIALSGNKDKGYLLKKSSEDQFSLINISNFDRISSTVSQSGAAPLEAAAEDTAIKAADNNKSMPVAAKQKATEAPDTTKQGGMSFASMLQAAVNGNGAAKKNTDARQQADSVAAPTNNTSASEKISALAKEGNTSATVDSGKTAIAAMQPPDNEKEQEQPNLMDSSDHQQNVINNKENNNMPNMANANNEEIEPMVKEKQGNNVFTSQPQEEEPADNADNEIFSSSHKNKKHNENLQFITFLPADSIQAASQKQKAPAKQKNVFSAKNKKNTKSSSASSNNNVQKIVPAYKQITENDKGSEKIKMINSDCDGMVSQKDYMKIRRKISREPDDASMYKEAEENIGSECYSVDMIENIVYLFNTDKYRYKYLELLYPHIYDSDHFSRLSKVFTDSYYLGHFKSMVK